jgi:soluble lytic murein transglycosylase
MSSMWRSAVLLPLFLGAVTPVSAQFAVTPTYVAPQNASSVSYAIGDWRRLRQSSGYAFADYARFLLANPGWPGESTLRRWAENAMRPGENSATVIAFFAKDKPTTGNAYARLTDALAASGRPTEALDAARNAWYEPDLSATDEQNIWSRYGGSFTRADQDRRVDALLFAKKPDDAQRFIATVSPERQAAFSARIAMQSKWSDAESRYQAVIRTVTSDAGLMMDRARYLRDNGWDSAARDLAARSHNFTYRPADPDRFYDMLLLLAGEAAQDRQWKTAYNIASQLDDVLPPGANVADQSLGIRDNYTSLAFLAGNVALDRLGQPTNAMAMYDRYGRAGRSLQVQTKGFYWAGRAALSAGRLQEANSYFQRAAAYPELFYGQLALERLGRSVTPPPAVLTQITTTPLQRAAFNSRRLVQAVRAMNQYGNAQSLDTDVDRNLAVDFGLQIGRSDIPVWVARMARIKGSAFYVRQAYPMLPSSVSPSIWSLAHGITRQESSFDQYAVSHAGARGMMQLMPGTAREQSGKMGVGYDGNRLTRDPSYNIMLGSAYFQRMLNIWNGSVPLAVASYNAGSGNVGKWVRNYGDPRGQVDMLKWIEAIPYTETRGYVQRVIENSVVYDSMRSAQQPRTAMHVSRYLGKSGPG